MNSIDWYCCLSCITVGMNAKEIRLVSLTLSLPCLSLMKDTTCSGPSEMGLNKLLQNVPCIWKATAGEWNFILRIVVSCRDGNLATKQIVFLQRPFLPQKIKKKQSKVHGLELLYVFVLAKLSYSNWFSTSVGAACLTLLWFRRCAEHVWTMTRAVNLKQNSKIEEERTPNFSRGIPCAVLDAPSPQIHHL